MIKLLVLLACFGAEKYITSLDHLRQSEWFISWTRYLSRYTANLPAWSGYLINGLPILFGVWFLLMLFGPWLFGGVGLVMQAVLLFICLGPVNFFQADTTGKLTTEDYLSMVNRQWFAVMFWYATFGILAALLYRLTDWMTQDNRTHAWANEIQGYLDWIPVRLLGVCYLLVGNFDQAFSFLSSHLFSGPEKNQFLLIESGLRAIRLDASGKVTLAQAQQLVLHAFSLFLIVIAVLVLAVWL